MEDFAFRINLRISSSVRSAYSNLLVVESLLQNQAILKNNEAAFAGKILSSAINFNPVQHALWYSLSKTEVDKLPGKPQGHLFIVSRKLEDYLERTKQIPGNNFKLKFTNEDEFTQILSEDAQYFNFPSYQDAISNPNQIIYSRPHPDFFTNQLIFTYSKAVKDAKGNILGVVGQNFGLEATKFALKQISEEFGLIIIETKDNKTLLEIPSQHYSVTGRTTSEQLGENNPFGSFKQMNDLASNLELGHKSINKDWFVYKVFKPSKDWFLIIYQSAWAFYGAIVALLLIIVAIILFFLFGFFYLFKRNKVRFLKPIDNLLNQIKKDTLIVGSQKSFSGRYPDSEILELNEIINCINTLFEIVNENFKNYRTELDKNIKSKEKLEQLVQKRSEQLIEREKLAALGFMSAGLAHEIKNPLNLICNAAEIVNMQLTKLDKAGIPLNEKATNAINRLYESNQIILNNGQRVDNIIKTLLMQIRNNNEGHEHLVDLGELIRTNLDFVLGNYRPKLNNRIEVNITAPNHRLILRANPVDLGRVFINIFDNSCYAMIKKVNLSSDFIAALEIKLLAFEHFVEVHVRDNGTGISKNDLNQIFTPFYTTKPPGEGTGLGLNFAYEIIKQHAGTIEINSTPGEFTEIIIKIPYEGKK